MDKYLVKGNQIISGLELLANPSKMIRKKTTNSPEDKILLFRKLLSERCLTYIPNKTPKDKYDNFINLMWKCYNDEKIYREDAETIINIETT
jgi:hypothetical protein